MRDDATGGAAMTEEEWLASDDPTAMLIALQGRASDRKLRLFAVVCWQRIWAEQVEASEREVVELFVGYVDGAVSPGAWVDGFSGAGGVRLPRHIQFLLWTDPVVAARETAQGAANDLGWRRSWYAVPIDVNAPFEERMAAANRKHEFHCQVRSTEEESQADLIREIFGNPFRPAEFSAEWRTDTAVSLARQMYDARDFSAMPILADALQDAGCDSDDVLNHCRDANQVHVRGCWVVDLVLNKS
jgi:hypothetical protein